MVANAVVKSAMSSSHRLLPPEAISLWTTEPTKLPDITPAIKHSPAMAITRRRLR